MKWLNVRTQITNFKRSENQFVMQEQDNKQTSSANSSIRAQKAASNFSYSNNNKTMNLMNYMLILIYIILSLCCFTSVNSHESNYYYYYNSDGDAIQVKNSESDEKNNIQSLLPKDFFSVFSSEMPILNSVENQSINENRDDSKTYSETDYYSTKNSPNQIPIVKFHPSILNFGEQYIGVPQVQTIRIVNIGSDHIQLESISGSTLHFYCSFFTDKLIPAGGNTSFDVYFLARELGNIESLLFISTNKGIIKYTVNGVGIDNPYNLKPILNARIPINSSFSTQIVLHNPHNATLQVVEIFSSDDDLHIEMPNHLVEMSSSIITNRFNDGDKNRNDNLNNGLWTLKPFETHQVASVHYTGRQANNHTAFICIRTKILKNVSNSTETIYFVLPFELEVTKLPGLFSPITQIDFGDISIEPTSSQVTSTPVYFATNSSISPVYYENEYNNRVSLEKSFNLYLTSSASTPLLITEVFSIRHNPALNITYLNDIILPPDTSHIIKIAKITFDPFKSKKSSQNYGKIVVKTNNSNISFQMNFNANLHKGSIKFNKNKFNYFVTKDETIVNVETINSIDFFNNYAFPITVQSINLNKYAQQYFEVFSFNQPVVLNPENIESTKVFKIKFKRSKFLNEMDIQRNYSDQMSISNLNHHYSYSLCTVHTSFNTLQIPIHIYDGKLSMKILSNQYEAISNLNLGSQSIDSNKELFIQIDNYNPIDISLNDFKIKQLLKDGQSKEFYNTANLRFLYFEKLDNNNIYQDGVRIMFNKTYINDDIKSNLKIPANHRMVVLLIISSSISNSDYRENFLTSVTFQYELSVSTQYENKNLVFQLKFVNGDLEIVSNTNKTLKNINISTFPTQISKYPVYLKSSFEQNLEITSIEFLNYGNLFSFKWMPYLNDAEYNKKFGIIQSNNVTLIGNIYFDPYSLCEPSCYVGFRKLNKQKTNFSDKLAQDQNIYDENNYENWIRSFGLKPFKMSKNDKTQLDAFDIDSKLFKMFDKRWMDFNRGKKLFLSSVRFDMQGIDYTDNKPQSFSFSFPVKFNFERPHLQRKNSIIKFPLSQVHTTVHYKNLSIHNPSGSSVLMQIIFLNNYPQKEKLLNLIENEFELFYETEHRQIVSNIIKRIHKNKIEESSTFSLHVPLTLSQFNSDHQRLIQSMEDEYNVVPSKNTFVFQIPSNETRTIQIKFKPNKIGHFEDMLVIRNNLTILDIFTLEGESGTAELNVNNMAPMRNSLFFDGLPSDVLTEATSTSDLSNLIIEMNKDDFANCDAKMSELTEMDLKIDMMSYKSFLEKLPENEDFLDKKMYKTSFRSKEGILLRTFLNLKNIGTTDLNVFSVLFDGEPCFSRGIELTDCSSFTIQPNNTFLLEVRYRPDFTMSLIRKSLTITTNIGDLEYLIEIKIPQHMLAVCHDSLPRPVFEEYLYYIGTFLVLLFIFIMLLTSMLESRSIIKYQYKMYRNLYSVSNEERRVCNQQEQPEEFLKRCSTTAQIISVNNKQRNKSTISSPNETLNNSNIASKNSINTISPPSSPRAVKHTDSNLTQRNLAKSLSSPRSANNNADNTAGLNSVPNINSKKITNSNISKKLKEKDIESDSSIATGKTNFPSKSVLSKQISSPVVSTTITAVDSKQQNEIDNKISNNIQPITKSVSLSKNSPSSKLKSKHSNSSIESDSHTEINTPILTCNNLTQKKPVKQNHAIQNELLAAQRRNYLNQQKVQKNNKSLMSNENSQNNKVIQTQKSIDLNLENFNTINDENKTNLDKANKKINNVRPANKILSAGSQQANLNNKSNGDRLDLNFLNNQYRQLQQQTPQLKEIKIKNETITLNKTNQSADRITNYLSKTSSTTSSISLSPQSSSPNPSLMIQQKKSQYDLLNILLNANRLEQEKSGEFSRSMSILSKRSSSSLSGIVTPGDSVSRSESPLDPNSTDKLITMPYTYHKNALTGDNTGKPLFKKYDTMDETNEKENFDDFLEHYAIISDNGSFYNEEKFNSQNSPLSMSSASASASDLWILPPKNSKSNELIGNQSSLDDDYDCIVQETEEFNKNFNNIQTNKIEKYTNNTSSKPTTKRPLNSNSPVENSIESHSLAKCSKKNSNLKASASAPSSDSYYDFNKTFPKTPITQSNSLPFTNSNKFLGPIQRPNTYQNNNCNNINNNITNNLFFALPNTGFSGIQTENDLITRLNMASATSTQTATTSSLALDQLLQLSGEDLKILSMIAATNMQDYCFNNNKLNEEEAYFNLLKMNALKRGTNLDVNNFEEFSLFGTNNDLDKDLEKKKNLLDTPFSASLTPELPEAVEDDSSYWPPIDSIKPTASSTAQPWNSVLLNDFDAPSSLASSSSGNHIRNLWSTKETTNTNENINESKKK